MMNMGRRAMEMSRIDGTIKWLRRRGCKIPNFDKVLRADYEIQEKEIEQLRNKVSELTEELEASRALSECIYERGVLHGIEVGKEKAIKRACKWFEDWLCSEEEWMRRSNFVVDNTEALKQAMKGK